MTDLDFHKGPWFGARHLQTLLLFLTVVVGYSQRLNVSVSLVAMTNAASTNLQFHEFDWDEKQRSYILSAFYWGYIITQLPAGYLASRVGVKLLMLLATLASTICTLLIPLSVNWGGWRLYCLLRFVQGLGQGFIFPLVHAHLATWSPCEELTRLGGLSFTGLECGSVLAMALSGYIAGSGLGWPGVFHIFGGIGLVFCLIWMIYAENSPSRSESITLEEKNYIIESQSKARDSQTAKIPVPWRALFTSVPFLSLTFVAMFQMWGSVTLQSYIPAYMHGVLKMDIKSNATFSTLPFLAMWICSYIFTLFADLILTKHWASLGVVRKSMNTIGTWPPAVILLAIGFLDESQILLALTLMILNVGLVAGQTVGAILNIIDLSPNHAGVLMAIINTICNLVPVISPLVNGSILSDETNRNQWQIVFLISAILFFVGNLQFIFLGSTDTQVWNDECFLQNRDTESENNADNRTGIDQQNREQRVF